LSFGDGYENATALFIANKNKSPKVVKQKSKTMASFHHRYMKMPVYRPHANDSSDEEYDTSPLYEDDDAMPRYDETLCAHRARASASNASAARAPSTPEAMRAPKTPNTKEMPPYCPSPINRFDTALFFFFRCVSFLTWV
jgi:hypothetical protein